MTKEFSKCSAFMGLSLGVALYIAGSATLPADIPTIIAYKANAPQGAVTNAFSAGDFQQTSEGLLALTHSVTNAGIWGGTADFAVQELRYDLDPIVYNNILMWNNSAVDQAYVVTITLPTTFAAPNQIRGSIDTSVIGTGTLISAPVGGAIYSALIDGNLVETLQDYPFTLGTSQPATSSSAAFGWDLSNIPVNTSIGIRLEFTLSPGDYAAIISDFEVVDVIPEPSTFALLGLGFMTLAMARRRA
ncbi:MAG: PEP-CTERM sorting domain-containing protein [Verrucomicrobia bacterium]|jgi:hypothetical protein|nr:PEP-CTERM sorting domain-containing protein [Verrucomicrobiota bacterium]